MCECAVKYLAMYKSENIMKSRRRLCREWNIMK